MFNNFTPYGNNYNQDFNTIITVVNEGMDILRKSSTIRPVSFEMLQIWQKYALTILKTISYDQNILLEYTQFLLTINNLSPYEQLSKSIEKLLDLARRI